MEVVMNAVIAVKPLHYVIHTKQVKLHDQHHQTVCRCSSSRSNEKIDGLYSGLSHIELEDHKNMEILESFQSSSIAKENQNDIWKLFKETQRNILYLNKRRLMALEEMKKTQQEKQSLLHRVEQLEVELASIQNSRFAFMFRPRDPRDPRDNPNLVEVCGRHRGPIAASDKATAWPQLLLRIDSMVLTSMITTEESSNIRGIVINNKAKVANTFSDIQLKGDAELLEELRDFSIKCKQTGFHIIHICTEMAPVASVGSLALYVTGISSELQENGNLVEVILPKYASLDLDGVQGLRATKAEFYSYFDGSWHGNKIWTGVVHGIGVTFIEPVNYVSYFNRDMIYGYSDDFERFSYFSRASLDYILISGKKPAILHIHDWETAIVGPLFWDGFVNQGLGDTRILFSCHDLTNQHLEHPDKLALCGLDPFRLNRHDRLQDNNKKHLVNILKGGIVYSNKVVIMSPTHSEGRTDSSLSHGMESTLDIHKEKLLLAPYGFDCTVWDPSKDTSLPSNYSADDLQGKAVCKTALRQRLELSSHPSKVVGCICSDVSDIDLESLKDVIQLISQRGAQFILMGSSKIPSINTALESFQKRFEDEDVQIISTYDEALSHLILAGADIILCPSFHDPLLQMPLKAIKYGAAPVALSSNHKYNSGTWNTGMSEYIMTSFGNTSLSEALDQIAKNPSQWNEKVKDGMAKDFSWGAECYDIHLNAYKSIKNL